MNYRTTLSCNGDSHEEIHWYLQDLAMMPVLSLKAEQEVVQQIATAPDSAEADAARTRLIEANLRLVVRLARRYQPFGESLADLVQEGNLALIQAAQQFDPLRSSHFQPFATRRVCRALYRVVEKYVRERHLVASDREPIHPLRAQVLKDLARNAIDEQALVFDLPEERFLSLTALLEEEEADLPFPDEHFSAHMYDRDAINPEEVSLSQERSREITACLQTLTTKERLVLTHLYLLDIAQTLEEVGRTLGISRGQVRELELRGVRKLRHPRNSRILRNLLSSHVESHTKKGMK
jgi:RNA polymerase primary sigma factor